MRYKVRKSYFPALYHGLIIFLLVTNAFFLGEHSQHVEKCQYNLPESVMILAFRHQNECHRYISLLLVQVTVDIVGILLLW